MRTMDSGDACIILSSVQQSHPFDQRRVCVPSDEVVRIGRAVARLQPAANNFIFDCKVLSRTHAVIWYEDGCFFVKDTKSSNGTFVNSRRLSKASEESGPYEIFSGDILQLGVDIVEYAKGASLSHSCIVAMLRLYHPNGLEALKRDSYTDSTGRTISTCLSGNVIQAEEMYQIQLHLRESAYREQLLESKLAALGALVTSTQEATDQCWQVLIDEDRLLSRIQTLEAQLELLSKNYTEDDLRQQLCRLTVEKEHIANAAKESLQRVMLEKMEAIQRMSDVEHELDTCVEDCCQLKATCEMTQKELARVVEQHGGCALRIKELEDNLRLAEKKYRSLEKHGGGSEAPMVLPVMPGDHRPPNASYNGTTQNGRQSPMVNGDAVAVSENNHLTHLAEDVNDAVYRSTDDGEHSPPTVEENDDFQLMESRQRIRQLQEELSNAHEELQRRAAEVDLLESRLKVSDRQLCNLVEEAVGDILRRFEEVIYQKFKNEELIVFLKDQVRKLEERFRSSLCLSASSNGLSVAFGQHDMDATVPNGNEADDDVQLDILPLMQQLKDAVEEDGQKNQQLQQQLSNGDGGGSSATDGGEEERGKSGSNETDLMGLQATVNEAEFANFRKECAALRQRVVTVEQEVKNSRKENAEVVSQYEQLKQSYSALQFDRKSLQQKQRNTDQQLDVVRRKNENLAEQLTATQKELKKIADCKALIELENVTLKAKLHDLDLLSGRAVVADESKQKPVQPLSLVPIVAVFLLLLSLAIAFYPWLARITLTSDGPTITDDLPPPEGDQMPLP